MKKGNMKWMCAFCRLPYPKSDKVYVERCKKRTKQNDAEAFYELGVAYRDEELLKEDNKAAFEFMNKAAELGSCKAHSDLATVYYYCKLGVEKDNDKAFHHMKLAAIGGHESSRHCLGIREEMIGSIDRAMKHFKIAAKSGLEKSLKKVGEGYKTGHVTKDEYASTLRAYQSCRDELKSEQRAEAAA